MLELIEGALRGGGILLRLLVEAGAILDISLAAIGRTIIRVCWPPHWKRGCRYPRLVEQSVGLAVLVCSALGIHLVIGW